MSRDFRGLWAGIFALLALLPAGASAQILAAQAPLAAPISMAPAPLVAPAAAAEFAVCAAPTSLSVSAALAPSAAPAAAASDAQAPSVSPAAAPRAAASAVAAAPAAAAAPDETRSRALFDGSRKLNILMAAAESVPFIKTGGLADVVDDVSRGLAARGHNVVLVLPKHRALKLDGVELTPAGSVAVPMNGQTQSAALWTARRGAVTVLLIDRPELFQSTKGPYDSGSVYGEDANESRWAFFSRAALEAARATGFRPDVVHAHDWHAALIPAYLKRLYAGDAFFSGTRSVVTIHNIAFQGHYSAQTAERIGFPASDAAPGGVLAHHGGVNYLKAGLASADKITTVSRTYAREIREDPAFGMGLEEVLRARAADLSGIVNGIDPALWGPGADALIHRAYGADDALEGKAANKADLQRRMGLTEDANAPIFAVASRLSHQKGIDSVLDAALDVVGRGGQLVITGSGDPELERRVAELVSDPSLRGRVAAHAFDEAFVHAVYAAADFLLMPSRFEPCGLSQLIAQRYGTLPIVARTGGLADTITDLRSNPARGDGLFIRDETEGGLWASIADAIAGYRNPEALAAARRAAMSKDSSWGPALDEYEALFFDLLRGPKNPPATRLARGDS